jgi:lipoprotein-anchoring transpeptidase ErfK/SrfK
VDPEGYACGELLEPSLEPPEAVTQPIVPDDRLMPFRYGYARADGARVYLRAEDLRYDDWDHELDPGFGIALDGPGSVDGQRVWRTRRGRFVRSSEIGVARPSDFAGIVFDERSATSYAWVRHRQAFMHARPGRRGRTRAAEVLGRHGVVPVLEERRVRGRTYLRVGDGPEERWIDARDVRRMTPATRPPEIAEDERWIDVDRAEQVLVAYEGDRPVFATLVSTGRALRSTPEGTHRVWVKLATSHMDNFEDEDAEELYSLEDVPWVMYFSRGVAIHGTFWHDRFGERRSHGCVNVSVRDARWLYGWTHPVVRDGWTAAFPTERSPGTPVVVR